MLRLFYALFVALCWVPISNAGIPASTGWYQIPNTTIDAVGACGVPYGTGPFPTVCGSEGQPGVEAWSGGVYDYLQNRLLVWGGGHGNYAGNEFYALNLSVDPITMTRLNNPTLPVAATCTAGIGTPAGANSRHTYDGIEYSRFFNLFFVYEGSLYCAAGDTAKDTWTYSFSSASWTRRDPVAGDAISTLCGALNFGMTSAWDSATGLIFVYNRCALYSYHPGTNTYRQVSSLYGTTIGYTMSATIDPVARQFILVGTDSVQAAFRLYSIDISGVNASGVPPTVLPDLTVRGTTNPGFPLTDYPGCDFYPRATNIVCWNGNDTVLLLNTSSWTWTTRTFAGGPGPASPTEGFGTHGRWRYSPLQDVFVVVNNTNQNAFALRLDAPLTSENDFSNRCAASGVIVCQGFDATLPISTGNPVTGVEPDWQGGYTRQAIDTTIKASGGGSFRLTIPANSDAKGTGDFRQVWTPAFGQGATMFTSFRFRGDSNFVNTDWNAVLATWPKVVIHHNNAATCADLEWTMTYDENSTMIPVMYTDCGQQHVVTNGGIPPYDYQQANLKCPYGGTTPINGVLPCLYFEPNKWMTFKFKATIGTWGIANSRFEAWYSVDGLPWRKWLDIPNYTINNTAPVYPGFDALTLTPYMTGRTVSQTAPQAQVWYDELIVSSADIAAPLPTLAASGGGVAATTSFGHPSLFGVHR